MTIIVTDAGFAPDDFAGPVLKSEALPANDCEGFAVTLPSDTAPDALTGPLLDAAMIRIEFPSFADGRGFTLARLLRLNGYRGRLRAAGHVISDQYAMVRRSGFDEVEISDDLAARQPEPHWQARANWQAQDYRNRLARPGG